MTIFFSVGESPSPGFSPAAIRPASSSAGDIESLDDAPPLDMPDSEDGISWAPAVDETPIPVSVDADDLVDMPISIDDLPGEDPVLVDDTDLLLEPKAATSSPVAPPTGRSAGAPLAAAASPTPEAPPAAVESPAATSAHTQFGLECGLCGSRVYATMDQVGQELTCPDCHSKVPVRAPRTLPPTQASPVYGEAEDYRLSDPVHRPQSKLVQQVEAASADDHADDDVDDDARSRATPDRTAASETPSKQPQGAAAALAGVLPGLDVIAASARSVLDKANAEAAEVERKRAKLPQRPFVTGVVSFLFETAAATRWLTLTLMLQIVLAMIVASLQGGMIAILFWMVSAPVSLIFLMGASVCFIAILHDTANGYEKIEGWPGLAFLDWMGDSLYVINALFASATPGILLCMLPTCAGAPRFLAFFGGLFTFWALFPLFLLSMSEEGTPLGIASGGVWRSLLTARTLWTRFYLASAGIVIGALFGVAIAAASSLLISALTSALVIALTLIYFRLLGRLAWCLAELSK